MRNAGDGTHYDGSGLMLIKKRGVGKWVYRYSHLGRRRDMGLGPLMDIGLADARKLRDKWAAVLASGGDPISQRNSEREAARREADRLDPTFEEMANTVFEARKAGLRGGGVRGRWFSPIRLYMIPSIGRRRMSNIHQSDIKAALSPIWKKKHPTAEKAIQRTRIVFEQARLMGVECDPFTVDAARHMLGQVNHRVTHLKSTPWQDIPSLYDNMSGIDTTTLCLKWCILTLVRSYGCRAAAFEEIDGDIWTVPSDRIKGTEGKVSDFRVPLGAEALSIALVLSEMSSTKLFPGRGGGFISDQALTKKLRRMGESGTIHGFRTSFRTWVQDTDACGFDVAETVLGHSIGGKVERSYARSDLLERRRTVMDAWASFVTGGAENVVSINQLS